MVADHSQAAWLMLVAVFLLAPVSLTFAAHRAWHFGLVWCSLPLQYLGALIGEVVAFSLMPLNLLRRSQPDMIGDTPIPTDAANLTKLIFLAVWVAAAVTVLLAFRHLTFNLPRG